LETYSPCMPLKIFDSCLVINAASGIPMGVAEGASRPGLHFRRGGTFGKNLRIYVKMVKFTLKKVTFL